MSKKRKRYTPKQEIVGIIIIAISAFIAVGIFTDAAGMVGNKFREICFGLFGLFAYILPPIGIVFGIYVSFFGEKFMHKGTVICTIIISVCIFCIVHLAFSHQITAANYPEYISKSFTLGIESKIGAGAVASLLQYPLFLLFGKIGSYILLGSSILVCILIITNISLRQIQKNIGSRLQERRQLHSSTKSRKQELLKDEGENQKGFAGMKMYTLEDGSVKKLQPLDSDRELDFIPGLPNANSLYYRPGRKQSQKESVDIETETVSIKNEIQNRHFVKGSYKIPPISMLSMPESREYRKQRADSRINANNLERTFEDFGIHAKVINSTTGPAITRFEVQPAPGVKVSRIINLADDIALSLAASKVRIEAPIPGKNAIGIEVPNKERMPVMLREVLDCSEFKNAPSKVSVALGKDIAGRNVIIDLSEMPHLLIAGTTGSGKSVCISTLILSILFKADPSEVKMIMIDPKLVELSCFNGIPHLHIPVVTDAKKAAGALNWALSEMTRRYQVFAEKGAKEITKYNDILTMLGEEKLPWIIVIIDELADLMMVAPREVEDAICRIAQMGRAAGIHLVVATQRPSVDVITGLIKANFPSRIALAVSSQTDSRTILDQGGAEKLLGKGDMLFHTISLPKPIRIQGAFVSDPEVEAVIEYIKSSSAPPKYDEEAIDTIQKLSEGKDSKKSEDSDEDDLLKEAIMLCVEAGQASTSLLQRRFRIGYSRAARLMDEMEAMGIISAQDGSRPRNVLITKMQLSELFGKQES